MGLVFVSTNTFRRTGASAFESNDKVLSDSFISIRMLLVLPSSQFVIPFNLTSHWQAVGAHAFSACDVIF
jgi:hypothetical protein